MPITGMNGNPAARFCDLMPLASSRLFPSGKHCLYIVDFVRNVSKLSIGAVVLVFSLI
jgi:hypothetical protein